MTQSADALQSSRNALLAIGLRLSGFVPGIRLFLTLQAALALGSAILIVGQSYLLAQIIARVFIGRQKPEQVFSLLLWLLVLMLLRISIPWLNEILAGHMAVRAKALVREKLLKHLLLRGPAQLKTEQSGELLHTLSSGVESLDAYFTQVLPQLCTALTVPIIVLATVLLTDIPSGLILLVTLPLLPIFMILIGKQSEQVTRQRWQELAQMSAHFLDVLQGNTTLKLFGRSTAQRLIVRQVSERFGHLTMQVLRIAFLSALTMEMGTTLSIAVVAVEVGIRLLSAQLLFAPALLVLLLAPEFYQPLRALGPQFHASLESAAGLQRIFALLDTPLACRNEREAGQELRPPIQSLQFAKVHYSYPGTNRSAALVDASFQAHTGQIVAIIGASGAGKSTLAHLLLRFAEPRQGTISLDGHASSTIPLEQWRKLFAWQPQHPWIFNMSIAENIAMGCPRASRAEIIAAARKAGLHEMVNALPQGYDTPVGERGARLSGGQIQRLSLARALLKRAPILVLDEATSALDTASEAQVLETLKAWRPSHIILMITHRLQTIREADLILLLNEGRIVASGTHAELQQRSALYQQLWQASLSNLEVVL
ncbi:thiol reductant ABC exporter subunit CydD [Ktedonosporobacter rubrisoli]|uniref:Thiol reductant ABC exporter subunit CydD n=1 Tax=Ktedonosporobacter rubrisoli TaxID=2509675 RepID=A0A4P6JU44_KTERU|nr:thiol reductant ABC exporter subunit CydD [Ktedonosporobacter rubrisoli]QBD78843.1 thiol reductant ABC exporter subunit CydD [Ktedonosporobacter rubrisoli]